MKKDLTKIFISEIYSKPPKKNFPTNKTIIKSFDDTWSSDLLDMNDYGIKNNKGYRYILVVIDNFSKFGWTIPLKNKYAQSLRDAFSQINKSSRRKPNLLETDDGKEYVNKIFNEFLNNHNIKRYSRYTDKGAVFAERFNRTIRNFLKKPVFEKGNADWLSELPSAIKQYNNTIHHSIKMTPIQASKKSNGKEVYSNLRDDRAKQKPKFKLGDLVRTSDIKKIFSKGDSTNYSCKLYTITEVIHDNNIVYCGFATSCLACSLRSHHHLASSKSDNIPARSFALLSHRLPSSQPLAYIIAQLYRASPCSTTPRLFSC